MPEGIQDEPLECRLSIKNRLARGETVRVKMPPLQLTYEECLKFAELRAFELGSWETKFDLGKPLPPRSAEDRLKDDERVEAYMKEHGFYEKPLKNILIN